MLNLKELSKGSVQSIIIHGYSEEELKKIPDNYVDLIITSPPYADRRKKTYGGISEEEYVNWFKPIAVEIKRILKPTGSFFLNIKPHTKNGERSLYVFDLVLMLRREIGFLFVEEYCWTKNAFPTGVHGRFKNGFEPVYHFTKGQVKNIIFNPLACGTPVSEETKSRAFRKNCKTPINGSGMVVDRDNFKKIEFARPSNVINANNVVNQFSLKSKHSAVFPEKLVEFFVKSFSNENDIVLDLFAGSGSVGVVCESYNRKYVLIEKEEENIQLIKSRLKK
jgi:DNA modification methylase